MAWPAGSSTTDFWSDGFGTDSAETWAFEGEAGLERLSGPQRISAPDPDRFTARLTRVQLDHVALEHFSATEHATARGDEEIAAFPTGLLTFVLVLEGSLEIEVDGERFQVAAGRGAVLDSRQAASTRTDGRLQVLRSVVGIEHIPAALRREGATVPGPLERSALVESYAAFVAAILRSTRENQPPRGVKLIESVAQLQTAILAEAQHAVGFAQGPDGLRFRIKEHIERHHTDPDLDVAAVARAVGVSVRHAHAVFNDVDRTIGQVIRDRRVITAAGLLRAASGAVRLDEIAAESGFASRDGLNRAFQHRYGMNAGDYHRGGYRDFE